VAELKATIKKNAWLVGGSQLIRSFMNQGLVDEIMLFVVPIMLKEGIPLFDSIDHDAALALREALPYSTGIVKLHYDISGPRSVDEEA
jgi:dihydrofolate reductase